MGGLCSPPFGPLPRYRRVIKRVARSPRKSARGTLDPADLHEQVRFSFATAGVTAITNEKRVRVNRQIRISPVRVIAADGEQLGIMSVDEAMATAEAEGLDLVEVAPNARPPVVRIMDYGKFKYEQARKARGAKKKQHQIQIKEVKFRPGIEAHDMDFKMRHARRFLEDGNKVKATMMFRGRQMAHPELGREVLAQLAEALEDVGKVESQPMLEGRNMTMILAPRRG